MSRKWSTSPGAHQWPPCVECCANQSTVEWGMRIMKNPDSRQASSGFKQTSFLPEPDFNPIYPSPNTLPARCLSMMLNGQTFTHPEFEVITGSWRLSAVVFKLKDLGWPVESFELHAPSPECSTRAISRYFLPAKAIKAVFGVGA